MEPVPDDWTVTDNPDESRYELRRAGDLVSFADYRREGEVLVVPYVETRRDLRGNGYADRLMAGLLEQLRDQGRRIRPLCSYAAGYVRDHPDQHDLLA